MRTIELGEDRLTHICVIDEPGAGGANHVYKIMDIGNTEKYADISFQDGPVQEAGINGCHQEDLLIVVLDRLQSFQAGDFACEENAEAITKIEEALSWLNQRTQDREDRGVEGTSEQ